MIRVPGWLWLSAFGVIAVFRLLLTGDRDIVAVNGPFDEYWYVSSALRLIWGGPYDQMAFAHLPVYSAWLVFLHAFGIPGRLAIEVAWLAACLYLAFALRGLSGRTWVAAIAFVYLALHPYTLILFDWGLAESLLTVLSAAALAGFIELWNCRGPCSRRRRIFAWVAAGLGFALAYHSRKEGIVLIAPLLLLAAWSILQRRTWWAPAERRSLGVPLVAVPIAASLLIGIVIAGMNAVRWGIPARHELAAPGYTRAMDALFAIDPREATPKHVTVTAKTRALAYQASPTFAQLRGFYEGPMGQSLAAQTAQYSGAPGEIANGWFYWSLRTAAAMAGWHKDAATAETRYNGIADELEDAFAQGKLPRRTVPLSQIEPDVSKWIGDWPAAFAQGVQIVVVPNPWQLGLPREDATPRQFEDFVQVFGRRRLPARTVLRGWVTAPPGSEVAFGAGGAAFAWQPMRGPTRPDVPGAFPFALTSEATLPPTQLHLRFGGTGETRVVELAALATGKIVRIDGAAPVHVGVDELSGGASLTRLSRWFGTVKQPPPYDWVVPWGVLWGYIGWAFAAVGVMGLIVGAATRSLRGAALMLSVLCLVAVLARVALIAILDASSWNGMQVRYFLPALVPFAAFGAVGAYVLAERLAASSARAR